MRFAEARVIVTIWRYLLEKSADIHPRRLSEMAYSSRRRLPCVKTNEHATVAIGIAISLPDTQPSANFRPRVGNRYAQIDTQRGKWTNRKTRALLRNLEGELKVISRANINQENMRENEIFSYKTSFSRESISRIHRIRVFKDDFLENGGILFYIFALRNFSEFRCNERNRYIFIAFSASRDIKIFIR